MYWTQGIWDWTVGMIKQMVHCKIRGSLACLFSNTARQFNLDMKTRFISCSGRDGIGEMLVSFFLPWAKLLVPFRTGRNFLKLTTLGNMQWSQLLPLKWLLSSELGKTARSQLFTAAAPHQLTSLSSRSKRERPCRVETWQCSYIFCFLTLMFCKQREDKGAFKRPLYSKHAPKNNK